MSSKAVTCAELGAKLVELADELELGDTPRLRALATEGRDMAYRVPCPAEDAGTARARANAMNRAAGEVQREVAAKLASGEGAITERTEADKQCWRSGLPRQQLFPLPSRAAEETKYVGVYKGGLETADRLWSDLEQARTLCASIQTGLDPKTRPDKRIPLASRRTAEKLRKLSVRFEARGGDGRQTGASDTEEGLATPIAPGMSWQKAQRIAEEHVRAHDGAFPSVKRMAAVAGCSRKTMDKAIANSPYLKARKAEAGNRAGRHVPLTEEAIDAAPQTTEPDPAALQRLIDEQRAEAERDESQSKRRKARRR